MPTETQNRQTTEWSRTPVAGEERTTVAAQESLTDEDVIALEREYWDALQNRDADALRRLTDDDSSTVGPAGVAGLDRRSIEHSMDDHSYRIMKYLFNNESVRINRIGDGAVSIAYAIHQDLEVDGLPIGVNTFDSSVWQRTGNGWTCAVHTEAIKGDPYGRDRKPMEERERDA